VQLFRKKIKLSWLFAKPKIYTAMKNKLHLKTIGELSTEQIRQILTVAKQFRDDKVSDSTQAKLRGKAVAQLYEKPSLRTRAAFGAAANDLGMGSMVFRENEVFLAGDGTERESMSDIIKNLEGFANIVLVRTHAHSIIEEIAAISQIPVINGLSDTHHPTQALCDALTIADHFLLDASTKVAYVGDGNNVAASLAEVCGKLGMQFAIATPNQHQLPKSITDPIADCTITDNPQTAVKNAHIVYTDTWVSMGDEAERADREHIFKPYQVTPELMRLSDSKAKFMHCLPAHRGYEVATEVIDGDQSIVFAQAHARRYIASALMAIMLNATGK
jgi:ornithine carbamoyltransferase